VNYRSATQTTTVALKMPEQAIGIDPNCITS